MAKDTLIQLRVSTKDKEALQKRAEGMYMSMSEYLVHAGVCYQPSERVTASLQAIEAAKQEFIDAGIKALTETK